MCNEKYIFPERLKELRLEKGENLKQLAKATGFSHASVCRWEQGTQVPNIQTITVLCRHFHVSSDYLIGIKDY